MKSMWIISKKYMVTLKNDLKSLENTLLRLLLKVNKIVTLGVQ